MKSINFNSNEILPSKIVCVGRNYVEHIYELNNQIPKQMVLFNKPNSAISDKLHYFGDNYRFEGELCFIIENKQIAGVGFGLDLTNKEAQEYAKANGLPWERAKAFDNSAVFSKFVSFDSNIEDLSFRLWINGALTQEANYDLMIHKPDAILKEIQTFTSLEDGDIIMSGTPKGVNNYKKGDKFKATIYNKDKELLWVEWIVV